MIPMAKRVKIVVRIDERAPAEIKKWDGMVVTAMTALNVEKRAHELLPDEAGLVTFVPYREPEQLPDAVWSDFLMRRCRPNFHHWDPYRQKVEVYCSDLLAHPWKSCAYRTCSRSWISEAAPPGPTPEGSVCIRLEPSNDPEKRWKELYRRMMACDRDHGYERNLVIVAAWWDGDELVLRLENGR